MRMDHLRLVNRVSLIIVIGSSAFKLSKIIDLTFLRILEKDAPYARVLFFSQLIFRSVH